jgi:hypothetical protein
MLLEPIAVIGSISDQPPVLTRQPTSLNFGYYFA